ncbi:uncharacterized protein [Argopecten irradians]|uniref:uncharacterized protein n=1 Tax=Argopecten irradians TaxID=31199 RepID=UPI00371EBFBD
MELQGFDDDPRKMAVRHFLCVLQTHHIHGQFHSIINIFISNKYFSDTAEVLSDYSDDFDDSSHSELEEDIPEDIQEEISMEQEDKTEGQYKAEDNSDVQYADDFEDYDSSEDLDQIVTQARVAQEVTPDDDFFSDDKMLDHHLTHTRFFKKQCIDALGGKKISNVGKLIQNGTLTESDFRRELRHTVRDSTEICHLDIGELDDG